MKHRTGAITWSLIGACGLFWIGNRGEALANWAVAEASPIVAQAAPVPVDFMEWGKLLSSLGGTALMFYVVILLQGEKSEMRKERSEADKLRVEADREIEKSRNASAAVYAEALSKVREHCAELNAKRSG